MNRYARVIGLIFLSLSLFLIAAGGIYGGVVLLLDPSGMLLGIPLSYLDGLPIHNYTLPGLWLLLVMGLSPLVILYGLWARPVWTWAAAVERVGHAHWAWIAALTLSYVLLLQLGVELFLGMIGPPTMMTGALGLVVLACAYMPAVRSRYALPPEGVPTW